MGEKKYDFCGWATKNDIRCSDGRIIRQDAFKECDGKIVPLVWNHQHDSPFSVLGHALLENRPEGVYTYGSFNDTDAGKAAKSQVDNGDLTSLSIYANKLEHQGSNVIHGMIREVSLVLAGANPGAFIDSVSIAHGDEVNPEEAVIFSGETLELSHAEETEVPVEEKSKEKEEKEMADEKEKTVKDVYDEFTDEQKKVVEFLVGAAVEEALKKEEGSDNKKEAEGEEEMKHNAFDTNEKKYEEELSHADMEAIFADARRYGSLKDSVLAHGITNIGYMFPDEKAIAKAPDFIKRNDDWVSVLMNGVKRSPFARVKSLHANLTASEARAKGYVKGNLKAEETIAMLKRTTSPATIYKKQKIDRDDFIDITDFDVVSWLKTEMRMMLNEEIARAMLVGDGRSSASDDKISPLCIRPIWTDDAVYTINKSIEFKDTMTTDEKVKAVIRAAVKARKDYKGSGNPIFFTTEDWLTDMLLMEDTTGRVIYETEEKLARALRVSKIVTVPVMESQTRTDSTDSLVHTLIGIIVNPVDYNVGADKGGEVNMFDDFDIDYNAQKYLIETRCSGALVKPYSAIAIESVPEPEDPEDEDDDDAPGPNDPE